MKLLMASRFPLSAHMYMGVAPVGSFALSGAPWVRRNSMISGEPLWAAMWSGVRPSMSGTDTLAPAETRRQTVESEG